MRCCFSAGVYETGDIILCENAPHIFFIKLHGIGHNGNVMVTDIFFSDELQYFTCGKTDLFLQVRADSDMYTFRKVSFSEKAVEIFFFQIFQGFCFCAFVSFQNGRCNERYPQFCSYFCQVIFCFIWFIKRRRNWQESTIETVFVHSQGDIHLGRKLQEFCNDIQFLFGEPIEAIQPEFCVFKTKAFIQSVCQKSQGFVGGNEFLFQEFLIRTMDEAEVFQFFLCAVG